MLSISSTVQAIPQHRTYLFRYGLSWLLTLALGLAASGQKRKGKVVENTQPRWATEALNPDAEKLPPRYLGHSLVALDLALQERARQETKDEFETTAAFRTRRAQLSLQPIWHTLKADDYWAFAIPVGKSSQSSMSLEDEPLTASYDADGAS